MILNFRWNFFIIIAVIILTAGLVFWFLFFSEKWGKIEISSQTQTVNENVSVEVKASIENLDVTEKELEQSTVNPEVRLEKITETESITDTGESDENEIKKINTLEVVEKLVATGFQNVSKKRQIDTIIIHSSYNSLGGDPYDVDRIIDIYKSYGVSAHYIIGRNGTIYRLVENNDMAYHAGVSLMPDGRNNVNDFSIGIEMIGNKTDGYAKAQYTALAELINDIKSSYKIKYVLGHSDIAPQRKDDPWNFDWKRLE